jgi:hypothetical protein
VTEGANMTTLILILTAVVVVELWIICKELEWIRIILRDKLGDMSRTLTQIDERMADRNRFD